MTNNTKLKRNAYMGNHILTNDYTAVTDTWQSGINNNVLIFGPSGAGKTRHYVRPNIINSHESMVISDTKGSLYMELGPILKEQGFIVLNIDFTDLTSGIGYNPMDYIRYDEKACKYMEKDIMTIASCLINEKEIHDDPFWYLSAKQYFSCLTAYVLESMPKEKHTFENIIYLLGMMGNESFSCMIEEMQEVCPQSAIFKKYQTIKDNYKADKMDQSIRGILSAYMDSLAFDDALALYKKPGRIDFASIGRRKTALFLTISDTDRSMDHLANMFFTQALQILCRSADKDYPDHMLPVPVRFYLDDFATNLYIPDFDKIISVIRSREISVSVILQSMTQLESLYGKPCARTIVNNCDRQLYMGGQDIDTAEYVSHRINRPMENILSIPLDDAILMVRGEKARISHKFDLESLVIPFPDEVKTSTEPMPATNDTEIPDIIR